MDPMANICANFDAVGQAFITHYYQVFDNDRSQLGSLYKDDVSMLNFEHNPVAPGSTRARRRSWRSSRTCLSRRCSTRW